MNARQVFLLHASHDCYHNARNWGANGVRNGVCNVTERRSIGFVPSSIIGHHHPDTAISLGIPYLSHAVRFRSVRGVPREVEVPLFSSKKVSLAGTPSVSQTRFSFSRPPPYDKPFFKSGRNPRSLKNSDANRCRRRQSRRINESDRVRRHSQGV